MKFDTKTISVLKNFSAINPSLLFKEGNQLVTISPMKSVLARAKLDQSFDKGFAIYDLSRFLSVLSLFDAPEIEINERSAFVRSDTRELEYRFADVSTIIVPPTDEITLPSIDVTFNLSEKNFTDISKAMSVLSMTEIAVVGDGEKVSLQVADSKNANADAFKIDMDVPCKTKFRCVFKSENLRLIPQDYVVSITSKGMAHFKGSSVVDVDFWIAFEAKSSKFEK